MRIGASQTELPASDRFLIRRRLGAGGMGVVYEALDRERDVAVALKTINNSTPEALLRLKHEFRTLRDIHHPNLVSLGELIERNGIWFFTMELVDGWSFLEYVRPGDIHALIRTVESGLSAEIDTQLWPPPPGVREPGTAPSFDEARLRQSLAQLARGLGALHDAGKVHRDVKPSNVLVGRDGRVVLLDFGLVADAGPADADGDDRNVVGTIAYMAPEQALGRPVGPEADWYSVGVVLYEALVGAPPLEGRSLGLLDKLALRPPPRSLVPSVPRDLDELCAALLALDPTRRPSGPEVLRALGAGVARPPLRFASASAISTASTSQGQLFVGRETELAALDAALAETRAGRQTTVHIHGESGIGKTALVRTFTERAALGEDVLVLAGRCYDRESVPYKAVDGVIDALARHLQRLPREEAAALLPEGASLLTQSFPVLKHVDALAEAPRQEVVDPRELHTRLFDGLRGLFDRLARRRTVIVAIDDLQWADHDGLALLAELVRPPCAPPFLLLTSWRAPAGGDGAAPAPTDGLPGEARHLLLESLPPAASYLLAHGLLARAGAAAGSDAGAGAALIAREALGHPLFIDELVRHAVEPGTRAGARPPRLDDVLRDRIQHLDPDSRRALEVVAVAGAPVEQSVAARAARMDLPTFWRHAMHLRVANLLRTTGIRDTDRAEPYHDRVRAAVLGELAADGRAACHRALARALEAAGRADPEALVVHYRGAGEPDKAGRHAAEAADVAVRALAFDQAARLYRLSLDLLPDSDPGRRRLRVALGDALANAGRGAEAARAYLAAVPGATSAAALDLQQRAGQQFLVSGHIDDGIATMRTVLQAEGIEYPRTPLRALLAGVTARARVRMRGLRFRTADESLLSPNELMRLDAYFHVGMSLALVDHIRGSAFNARGLLLALRAGEPYRLARALALEGAYRGARGGAGLAQAEALFARADELAARVSNPHAAAFTLATRGQTAFLSGRFREGLAICERAEALFRDRCVGAPWETNTMRLWSCRALHHMGQYAELFRRVPVILQECARRNDRYGATTFRVSVAPYLHLAAGEPVKAREEVALALRAWSPAGFHVQHYYANLACTAAHLYQGNAGPAGDGVRETWPHLVRSLMMRVAFLRGLMHELRARTTLAAAAEAAPRARRALLAAAERDARDVERVGLVCFPPGAELLRATIARLEGDAETARGRLRSAIDGFQAVDMALHAAAARRRLGGLIGGDEGRLLVRSADNFMASQGIASPERLTAMLAPGW